MPTCHCDSGRDLDECCLPVIRGERQAETAAELMRSRYSAFVTGDVEWIIDSHHSDTVDEIDRGEVERWSKDSEWLGLKISGERGGGAEDDEGLVEFRARYRTQGQQVDHDERAHFEREDGQWKFHSVLDEEGAPELVPVVASSTVGRNDPCTCGSGKKYKKCCGASA